MLRMINMCFDSEMKVEEEKNKKLLEGNSNNNWNIKLVWCAII